ncbi:GNAT family N-acetyltransferase [Brumimicrobium mesophilum]|uniref:GNAT family N-acetyltransferase n=1 Tax=Brumimicrobium mesophilum TaxID=392717 RepID=UPI000D14189F|nr:GNAT family N-acetyltransferase [Brumimicrobium mesophilum]
MEGKWINQREIDREDWDQLVAKTVDASIYVCSFYLDATAIDWEAFVADDFSFAIPVGVVPKGGITRVYPPLFQRYVEAIGEVSKIDWSAFEKSLLKRYSKGDLNVKTAVFSQTNNKSISSTEHIHQVVNKEHFKLKTQAKRMIKRFGQTKYEIREENIDTGELSHLIARELSKKLPIYASKDVQHLYDVVEKAEENGFLYKVGVFDGEALKGGLIGLKFKDTLLYLKGTAEEELQQEGAMYALMEHFITYGFEQGCKIDFGGSRVKGIQFFNSRFSGVDVEYFVYSWDKSPFWFKWGLKAYRKFF